MANRYVDATLRFFDKFTAPMQRAVTKMEAQHRQISATGRALEKRGRSLSKFGDGMTKAVTLPLAGIAAYSYKSYVSFEDNIAKINTLLDDKSHLKGYETTVKQISTSMGIDANKSAQGMYQTISVLGDHGRQTERTFQIMAKAAKAGGADVVDSVNMIATAMNGYGQVNDKTAQRISDLAFKTVKLGKTTFPELAQNMSPLFPLAHSLGISYEELYATMSTATTSFAGNTAEASTQIKGLMTGFLKPSKDMQALYQKLGVSSGEQLIKQKGLAGALQAVQKEAGKDGMPKYFKNVRGLTAALGLSGSGMKKYKKHLEEMGKAAGTTGEAFEKMESTTKAQIEKLKTNAQAAGINLGGALARTLNPLLKKLNGWITKFNLWFDSLSPKQQKAVVKIGLIAAAIGPILSLTGKMITHVGTILKAVGKIGKAFDAAGGAAKFFSSKFGGIGSAIAGSGGIGGVFSQLGGKITALKGKAGIIGGLAKFAFNPWTLAIGGVVTGFTLLYKHNKKFRKGVRNMGAAIKRGTAPAVNELKRAARQMGKELSPVARQARKQLGGAFKELGKQMRPVAKVLGPALLKVLRVMSKVITTVLIVVIKGLVAYIRIWIKIITTAIKVIKTLIKWFKAIPDAVRGLGAKIASPFKTAASWVQNMIDKVKSLISWLGSVPGKIKDAFGSAGKKVLDFFGFAGGTDYAPGGWSIVGEEGPEIVKLPRGSQVKDATDTNRMLRTLSRPARTTVAVPQATNRTTNINITIEHAEMSSTERVKELAYELARLLEEEADGVPA